MNKDKARVYVIIGGAWGDEGKGKVATFYGKDANLVIRATGGANAGHTIYVNGKKHALHLIPGGIIYPKAFALIGQGVVLDLEILLNEIEELKPDVPDINERLKISGTASVLMPYHKKLDKLHEKLKDVAIQTTGKGIGPAYADKINRVGLKVYDLLLPEDELAKKIDVATRAHNCLFRNFGMKKEFVDANNLAKVYHKYGELLSSNIVNGHQLVKSFLYNPENIIVVEGAQSVRLSIEVGDYPNVTSSDSNSLGTLSGAHLSHKDVTEVINVYKAYFSRVGNGSFPTEFASHIGMDGKLLPYDSENALIGDELREFAGEYGATTGRPRRTGAFDVVLAKHSAEVSGADYICINHIDSIGTWGLLKGCIKICELYEYNGKIIDFYPDDMELTKCLPIPRYTFFEGGWEITEDMKTYDDLPNKAKDFIEWIELIVNVPVKYIGIGPKNEDIIVREDV